MLNGHRLDRMTVEIVAQGTHAASFPVGMRQLEYIDPHDGGRQLALTVFYPAAGSPAATRFVMPFGTPFRESRRNRWPWRWMG